MNITIDCPPMNIYRRKRKLRRTAAEPMTVTIEGFEPFVAVIPATDVHQTGLLPIRWLVDACEGRDEEGAFVISLPPEPTFFELFTPEDGRAHMVAMPIKCGASWYDSAGKLHFGIVTFPRCLVDWGNPMVARAVVATGTLDETM